MTRRGVRWLWHATWLPATVAAAPLLWLVVRELRSLGHDTAVCCDWAVLQIETARAGRFEATTGAYSRYGWHHPGPVALYLAAPFHRLAGSDFVGLTAATAVLNAVWVFVVVHLLRLRAGAVAGWTAGAVVLLFLWGFGLNRLSDPWNPLLVVLPTAVAAVALACAADGLRWALPVAALAGSVAVQSHVGAAPTVGAMGLCGAVLVARVVRHQRRAWLPALLVTVGVLAVVWAPPIGDQLANDPGNLGRIAAFARAGHPGQTWTDAVDVVVVQVGLGVHELGGYLIGGQRLPGLTGPRLALAGLQFALLAGAVIVAGHRGRTMVRNLGLVAAAGGLGALVGATRVTGLLEGYLTAAAIGVGLAVYLTVALGAVDLAVGWARRQPLDLHRRRSIAGAQGAIVAGSVMLAVVAIQPQIGTEAWSRQISTDHLEALDRRVERELGPGDRVVFVDFAAEQWQPAAATVAEVGSSGRTVTVQSAYEGMFRTSGSPTPPDVCIRYTADRDEVETRPGAQLLWMGDIVGNGHLSTVLLLRGPACGELAAAARPRN